MLILDVAYLGGHIYEAAEALTAAACRKNGTVYTVYENDIILQASPETTARSVIVQYAHQIGPTHDLKRLAFARLLRKAREEIRISKTTGRQSAALKALIELVGEPIELV
jgi:hypothetical protein